MDGECDFMFDVPFPDERGSRSTDTRRMDDRSYSSLSAHSVRAQAYTECSPSTALKAAQESGSMLGIGIVLGDLLSQGFQVGFDMGVPFVFVEINFVYGGKPEQRSRFNDHFTSMPTRHVVEYLADALR